MQKPIDFNAGKKWLEDKKRCLGQLSAIKADVSEKRRKEQDLKTKAHFDSKERI